MMSQDPEILSQHSGQQIAETAFEKRRGIHQVEVRSGFAQVHVSQLAIPLQDSRLSLLRSVAEAGVSIDFLKLTSGGISFMVAERVAAETAGLLNQLGVVFSLVENLHIVIVHAVNMRDEEGLIADVMARAIRSGAQLEHVTDMHDRMLIVVPAGESTKLAGAFEQLAGSRDGS